MTLPCTVGRYVPAGFPEWSMKTDAVLAEQRTRLKRLIETGLADSRNTDG